MKVYTVTAKVADNESLKKDIQVLGIVQRDLAKKIGVYPNNLNTWIKHDVHIPEKYIKPIENYIEERKKRT